MRDLEHLPKREGRRRRCRRGTDRRRAHRADEATAWLLGAERVVRWTGRASGACVGPEALLEERLSAFPAGLFGVEVCVSPAGRVGFGAINTVDEPRRARVLAALRTADSPALTQRVGAAWVWRSRVRSALDGLSAVVTLGEGTLGVGRALRGALAGWHPRWIRAAVHDPNRWIAAVKQHPGIAQMQAVAVGHLLATGSREGLLARLCALETGVAWVDGALRRRRRRIEALAWEFAVLGGAQCPQLVEAIHNDPGLRAAGVAKVNSVRGAVERALGGPVPDLSSDWSLFLASGMHTAMLASFVCPLADVKLPNTPHRDQALRRFGATTVPVALLADWLLVGSDLVVPLHEGGAWAWMAGSVAPLARVGSASRLFQVAHDAATSLAPMLLASVAKGVAWCGGPVSELGWRTVWRLRLPLHRLPERAHEVVEALAPLPDDWSKLDGWRKEAWVRILLRCPDRLRHRLMMWCLALCLSRKNRSTVLWAAEALLPDVEAGAFALEHFHLLEARVGNEHDPVCVAFAVDAARRMLAHGKDGEGLLRQVVERGLWSAFVDSCDDTREQAAVLAESPGAYLALMRWSVFHDRELVDRFDALTAPDAQVLVRAAQDSRLVPIATGVVAQLVGSRVAAAAALDLQGLELLRALCERADVPLPRALRRLLGRRAGLERELREASAPVHRLERLAASLADPDFDVRIQEKLRGRLPRWVLGARLDELSHRVRQQRGDALAAATGKRLDLSDPDWNNAAALLQSTSDNKRTLKRLLRDVAHARWSRSEHPRNRWFLEQVAAAGLRPEAWLQPVSVEAQGRVVARMTDPLKVLQMGNLFGTCLSVGQFNSFSTVANAVEVNKAVLFVHFEGRVVGRRLVVLHTDGTLIPYHPYGAGLWPKILTDLAVAEWVARGAGRFAPDDESGLPPTKGLALFSRWYDDGTVPVDAWVKLAGDGVEPIRAWLASKAEGSAEEARCAVWLDDAGWLHRTQPNQVTLLGIKRARPSSLLGAAAAERLAQRREGKSQRSKSSG
jgi:hypothetical protein